MCTHRLTLFMTFCCCVWFCLSDTTSRHSTSFCLQMEGKHCRDQKGGTSRTNAKHYKYDLNVLL